MKNVFKLISIFLLTIYSCKAQICLRTTFNDKINWTWISVNGIYPYSTSNADEKLCVKMTQKSNTIFILGSEISIEIINIPENAKLDLGDIEIPMRKTVTENFEVFTEEDKKMITTVYCYTQLVGYQFLNQLENPKIIFTCNNDKFEFDKFEFNIEEQKVVIDWKNLKSCIN